jgi:hypothetical protein
VTKETPGASTSGSTLVHFPKDYLSPRKPSTKSVRLQKEAKYKLVEPKIPLGVIINEDMLGTVGSLRYVDHDITDMKKFPDLAPEKYKNVKVTWIHKQSS